MHNAMLDSTIERRLLGDERSRSHGSQLLKVWRRLLTHYVNGFMEASLHLPTKVHA